MEGHPRRRRRPALSCLECRRRKIKCDRNDPCRHCIAADTQCIFQTFQTNLVSGIFDVERTSTMSTPTLPDAPANKRTKESTDRGSSSTATQAGETTPHSTTLAHRMENQKKHQQDSQDSIVASQDISAKTKTPEQGQRSTSHNSLLEDGRSILAAQFGLERSQMILNKTRTLRSSHWMGTAPEFSLLNSCFVAATGDASDDGSFQGEEIKELLAQIGSMLRKCKTITRSLKAGLPSRSPFAPQLDLALPLGDAADDLVELYLSSFESATRIIHVPTFRSDYRRFRDSPESARPDLRLKILLVVGLGSSLRVPDPAFRSTVQQWVHEAQTWLAGPVEKDRLSIIGIQIHCLVLLARQVFNIGGDLVWMSTGSVINTAMQIGLHRDPRHLPPMSFLQAELRRRLWATILELTLQASLDAAMPPRISLDEFDTARPSNVDDENLTESSASFQSLPEDVYTGASMQLLLLDALPTRLRILQLLNGLHSEIAYEDVLALSSDMNDALRKCAHFIKVNRGRGTTPFHSNLIDYLVRRFMIPLHCAFACKARSNPLFQSSLKICLDTALALVSPDPDEGFSRLLAVGGGLFREGLRYSCSVVSLAFIAETEAQSTDGTLHRTSAYRNVLKQALQDLISLSAERIRQGENNVKMHMFLSMAMGQVEAVETATSVERGALQRGRDSLEFCYGLLQERASNYQLPVDPPPLTEVDGWHDGADFDWNTGFFMSSTAFF